MALTTGIKVASEDILKKGGLRAIYLTEYSNLASVAITSGQADVALTSAKAYAFQFELETANWSFTATSERGSTLVEHTIEFYVPNMQKANFEELKEILNVPIVAICEENNVDSSKGKAWLVGYSETYSSITSSGSAAAFNDQDQMYAMISSIEGSTGSAFSDTIGCTVRITARSGDLPYLVPAGDITRGSTELAGNYMTFPTS